MNNRLFNMPAGIMFHHFHGDRHAPIQGSIDPNQLSDLIEKMKPRGLLGAQDWLHLLQQDKLPDNALCLTFDDNLLSQFELALPVLGHHDIEGFWFAYTGPYEGQGRELEMFRCFRNHYFDSINEFYAVFFEFVENYLSANERDRLHEFDSATYLIHSEFYSDLDREFRFLRDQILGEARYFDLMKRLMVYHNAEHSDFVSQIWIPPESLKELHNMNHVVGLHSHTHPTSLASMDMQSQHIEFERNSTLLSKFIGATPFVASYPNGSYSSATLDWMRAHQIKLAFRANMALEDYSPLEVNRVDQTDLRRMMTDL